MTKTAPPPTPDSMNPQPHCNQSDAFRCPEFMRAWLPHPKLTSIQASNICEG